VEVLTSLKNPRIQSARKLNRRHIRDIQRAFLIEGAPAVLDAAAAGQRLIEVFVTETADRLDDLRAVSNEVTVVTEPVLRAVAGTENPSGVVAVVEMPSFSLDALGVDADLVLVLARVRDPGNAGTLVRSARAAGADAVVFSEGSVDPFAPKTVRASAGAVAGGGIARDVPLPGAVSLLRDRGFAILGSSSTAPATLYESDLTGRVALCVGNEAWGLPEAEELVDAVVSIPMPGGMESLNVAVAGSLLLFEALRQRREASS
jgi:TrmH family RNA methyltransferase